MTSHDATNEKLQKLMNKEDTLTKTESAMAAYRKTFKASCFLCDDGAHLVANCSYLSKAQIYIKEKVVKARSTSRNRNKSRKSRRHHHHHSSSGSEAEASTTSLESIDSEVEKKKKKKSDKKPSDERARDKKKDKKKGHAYAAVSDSDSDNDDNYPIKAYGAISDSGSDVDDADIHAYIATAKDQRALNELLMQARVMRGTVGSSL